MKYRFETKSTREIYDSYVNDPEYLSLHEELSLIRTAVQLFVTKVERQGKLNGEVSPEIVAFIATLAKDVASVVTACAQIERGMSFQISVEGLDAFLGYMLDVLKQESKDDELIERVAKVIGESEIPIGRPRLPLKEFVEATKNKDVPDGGEPL